jgi:transcriptional regulator of NAD metabolism
MIEFTSSQLSWILIGACSIGGTGYITIDNKMSDMDKKVAVIQTKAENTDKKLDSMTEQLTRVEDMLRNIKGPR